MHYLLAAIGAGTVAVLLWKAFGPESADEPAARVPAPDDDPDFLRELERRKRRGSDDD